MVYVEENSKTCTGQDVTCHCETLICYVSWKQNTDNLKFLELGCDDTAIHILQWNP